MTQDPTYLQDNLRKLREYLKAPLDSVIAAERAIQDRRELQARLDNLSSDNLKVLNRNDALLQERKALKQVNDDLSQEVSTLKEANENLIEEMAELATVGEKEVADLRKLIEELHRHNNGLQSDLAGQKAHNTSTRQRHRELIEEGHRLKAEKSELHADVKRLEENLTRLSSRNMTLEREITDLRAAQTQTQPQNLDKGPTKSHLSGFIPAYDRENQAAFDEYSVKLRDYAAFLPATPNSYWEADWLRRYAHQAQDWARRASWLEEKIAGLIKAMMDTGIVPDLPEKKEPK